jgi:outer membrane translocation and assembly module TamA
MSVRYPIYQIKKAINIIEDKKYPQSSMAITNLTITKKTYIVDIDLIYSGERIIMQNVIFKKKLVHRLIEKI